jgi:hypothetical protein
VPAASWTRRSIIGGVMSLLATRSLQAAPGHELRSDYESVPKAAWAWRLQSADLRRMPQIARQQGLTRILLSLSKPLLTSLLRADVQTVDALKALTDQGITVAALLGRSEWVRQPRSVPIEILSALQIHNRTGLFDALHLDVEPHTLPEWHGPSRDAVAERYLTFVSTLSKAAGSLPLELAIHPVYADVAVAAGGSLLLAVTRLVNEVSVMAYRNLPQEAVRFASGAVRVLESSGIDWRFGVLTHKDELPKLTYAGMATDEFQQSMISLNRLLVAMSPSGRYRGLIFEDYLGLLGIFGRD